MQKWGHKIYWVFQEPVYLDFLHRYNFGDMNYNAEHTTVFAIHDLRKGSEKFDLFQARIESSTIDDLVLHANEINTLQFPAASAKGEYHILVRGISNCGDIISGVGKFTVK